MSRGFGGGGWMGAMGTVGGLTRTYGLHRQFERAGEPREAMPGIDRAMLRRIAGYFWPYRTRWVVILACVGVTAALGVLPPFCVGLILDRAIPEKNGTLLAGLALAMVGLACASGLIGVLQQSLTAKVVQGIMFDLRTQLYRHLQRMSVHYYTATRSGEIISRVNNDVGAVQHVTQGTIVQIASNVATLAATAFALFSMNWKLALLALTVVPTFYLPSRIVGGIRRRLAVQTQDSQAELMAFMHDRLHVGGAVLTKIFGQAPAEAQQFGQTAGHLRDLHIRQAVVGRWLFMTLSVFSAAGPAIVYWYGGLQVIHADLTPGLLVAFAALLTLLYRPLMQLATVYVDVQAAVAVFHRIFACLDRLPDVDDAPAARAVPAVQGRLVLENVGFSYPVAPRRAGKGTGDESEQPRRQPFALQDVSFEVAPGERVALVGPSGSGKTTITYLVPRFYDPQHGRITLDGVDLRDIDQASLRQHIGMVTQETFLFHASIRDNLQYARPGATEAELIDACKAANIHDFIADLPDGYDTIVGERGFRLSGGEKQRLSIARAVLKDPAILILDEATSSLDATSEYLIQAALDELLHGRTSLIIAHRLSTILASDRILVIDQGRVVESGKHEALLEQQGLYASLFEQQFGKVLERDRLAL